MRFEGPEFVFGFEFGDFPVLFFDVFRGGGRDWRRVRRVGVLRRGGFLVRRARRMNRTVERLVDRFLDFREEFAEEIRRSLAGIARGKLLPGRFAVRFGFCLNAGVKFFKPVRRRARR